VSARDHSARYGFGVLIQSIEPEAHSRRARAAKQFVEGYIFLYRL